jgi:hypothetical protein
VAPLEFWKNEKLVFDKTNDGLVIKSVIRAAPEKKAAKPLNSESNKRKRQPRSETKPPPARRQRTVREEDAQEDRHEYESENYSHDSMDEDQELKNKGLSEDAKVTADVLVFGSDNVVLKGNPTFLLVHLYFCGIVSRNARNVSLIICYYFCYVFELTKTLRNLISHFSSGTCKAANTSCIVDWRMLTLWSLAP